MGKKKILGWGECVAKTVDTIYDDIVEGSAALSVEEGTENEANTEGGKAEGRQRTVDKYITEFDRRVGDKSEVSLGFVNDAGPISIIPKNQGAAYAKLLGCSLHTTIKQDSTDGLVIHYEYKTKGSTDSQGKIDDVVIDESSTSVTFTAVQNTAGKNPYDEGWYVKDGENVYKHAFETTPKENTTYYEISEEVE